MYYIYIYICVNSTHPTIDKNSEHVTLVQTGCMRAFMSVTGYIEKLRVVELTVTGDALNPGSKGPLQVGLRKVISFGGVGSGYRFRLRGLGLIN